MKQPTASVVAFDCDGVLYANATQRLLGLVPLPKQQAASDIDAAYRHGYTNAAEYTHQLVELTGLSQERIAQELSAELALDAAMMDIVRQVYEAGAGVALFSNASREKIMQLFSPEQIVRFEAVVLASPELGTKPAATMYQALQRAVYPKTHIILIDDSPANIAAAAERGMAGHQHTEAQTTRQYLVDLGIL